MNKRLAAVLFSSFLAVGLFVLPAWTQQTPSTAQQPAAGALPTKFDLRTKDAVTPIKKQEGGTCWTHGTMAAIESNLLLSGKWKELGMTGIPKCSEYHLDWWNGFNKHNNQDVDDPAKAATGMTVHQGGDYKVAAAYISRGDGVVILPEGVTQTQWSKNTPKKDDPTYKKLYVRDIEFFTMGDNLEGINVIKSQVMKYGAMGTANKHGANKSDNIHYQPIDSKGDPNHSIAIVGWDDSKITSDKTKTPRPPAPGAWLIKNSHGVAQGEEGYHWISYYDKHSGRHPEMGAVTFRNVEWLSYSHIYYHDAHGWRDTLPQVTKAMNAFKATGRETIKAVSFYTAQHNVNYTVTIFSKFDGKKVDGELVKQTGSIEFCGFHTIDVMAPVSLKENDNFYVCVELSAGGHPIDRTSNIPVLLEQPPTQAVQPPAKAGDQPPAKVDPKADAKQPDPKKGKGGKGGGGGGQKPIVLSKASPAESFYFDGFEWRDLYDYPFVMPEWAVKGNVTFNHSANFCMKALTVKAAP